jgi:hypothetical protein
MIRKILAISLAVPAIGATVLSSPSVANSDHHGAYHQQTGNLRCIGQVHDDGDGGKLSVTVRGREVRPEDDHFRTAYIRTRLVAEERTYSGSWKGVKRGKVHNGRLGATWDAGANNVSPFVWGGRRAPRFGIIVAGFDDLFRVRLVTRVFSDEGALLAKLVTREGTCRL